MSKTWGIPYQGSKGRYAPMIFRAISQRATEDTSRRLLDPFCGGFAVSHYFRVQGWETVSSDLDKYTVALLNASLDGSIESMFSKWISRETFMACRDTPETSGFTDAEVGFVRNVWSFGNTGTSYLYGRHLEEIKRSIHFLVVHGEIDPSLTEITGVPLDTLETITGLPTVRNRVRGWRRAFSHYHDPQKNADLQFHSIVMSSERSRTDRIRNLTPKQLRNQTIQIQHLSQGKRVRELPNGLSNTIKPVRKQTYQEAIKEAVPGDVVYFDPPYADTHSYVSVEGEFDHAEMWDIADNLVNSGVQVYVSEYTAPENWESILSFSRPNTLAADSEAKSTGKHREHLFVMKGS